MTAKIKLYFYFGSESLFDFMGTIKNSLMLLILVSAMSFCSSKKDKNVMWVETVGTYKLEGYRNARIHYAVNGSISDGSFPYDIASNADGEKYTMRYNAKDPEEIQVDYWHPIFEQGETRYAFTAKVLAIQKDFFWSRSAVYFSYEVLGNKIKKAVYLPPNYKELYPNLTVNQYYVVECWEKNAHRAVIHLDKLVNNINAN